MNHFQVILGEPLVFETHLYSTWVRVCFCGGGGIMKDFSCWKESCLKLQVPVLFFQPLSWNYIVMGNRDALLQIIFLSRFSINISWFEFGKCFLCASTAHVNKDTQSSFRFTNDLPVWHGGTVEVWWGVMTFECAQGGVGCLWHGN